MERREFMKRAASLVGMTVPAVWPGTVHFANAAEAAEPGPSPFRYRGYYTIGTRHPTAGLDEWKSILDAMHDDGCNLLIHWMAGGFRSRKFPETWRHNVDHANVQSDFTRELIDYAHQRGIQVILGFTPYGYDGVNLHTEIRPDLIAQRPDGSPVGEFGISCWGRSLCPAQPDSQAFMLDYIREMIFEFYPNADGLFIESSDYSTCWCETCKANDGAGHFEQEFAFVKQISEELWGTRDDPLIVVYPHYFSGDLTPDNVSQLKAKAASLPFDDRWTLFFTPHSTAVNADLIRQAKNSIWWDPAMIFGTPGQVQSGALTALAHGCNGYIPSLEAYSFVATHVEDGEPWTKGVRQIPLGIGWLSPDQSPYTSLPIRTIRLAYREFVRNPSLSLDEYRHRLGREVFQVASDDRRVDDLLFLQRCVNTERNWSLPSPLVEPLRAKGFAAAGTLNPERKAGYRASLQTLREIAERYAGGSGADAELAEAAGWIVGRWGEDELKLLRSEG